MRIHAKKFGKVLTKALPDAVTLASDQLDLDRAELQRTVAR